MGPGPRRTLALGAVALAVFVAAMLYLRSTFPAHVTGAPSLALLEEEKTMASWWHDPAGQNRRIVYIQILRRDYNSNTEWAAAVGDALESFPPIDDGGG